MHVNIDAWLERRDPQIRLVDADTGREIMRIGADQVRKLMDCGDLCPCDFDDPSCSCEELLALAHISMVDGRDPTRQRVPAYMGYSQPDIFNTRENRFK